MIEVISINDQTWLICGGRDFADQEMFDSAMSDLVRLKGMPRRIVHGACRKKEVNGEIVYDGADGFADKWAKRHAIDISPEPADWDKWGKSAGPLRNSLMLDKYPIKFVVAFPGGRGTADMVRKAKENGIDVAEIKRND